MSVHLGVGTLVQNSQGEYLIIQEAKEYVKGKWNIPSGGYSRDDEDHEETIREGAVRETREESGLKVQIEGLIGIYVRESEKTDKKNVNIIFEASEAGGQLGDVKDEEVLDAKFLSKSQIAELDLRFDIMKIINDFEAEGSQEANIKQLNF